MDIEKLRQEWKERLEVGKSQSTVRNYTNALGRFIEFADQHEEYTTDPATWNGQAMVEFDQHLIKDNLSAATRHLYESAMRQFGNFLALKGWGQNRFEYIDLPEVTAKRPDIATKEDVMKALKVGEVSGVIDRRDRALVWLMYAGALRRAEARALTFDQLHLDQDYIRVLGKGKKRRTIPLTDKAGQKAVRFMKGYLEQRHKFESDSDSDNPYVFWGRRAVEDQPLSLHTIWRICKDRTGYSPHDLRRARLTHLAEANLPAPYLQDFAGHASMETTMRYYVSISDQKMANAIRDSGA